MTMPNAHFQLQRDSYGRLVLTAENGERHEGVTPVRAFPIAAPDEGISLVNYEGHEVAWTDCLADLPPAIAELIEAELASREFVPEIERIVATAHAERATCVVMVASALHSIAFGNMLPAFQKRLADDGAVRRASEYGRAGRPQVRYELVR